ncbi:MAG: type IV pilin protein [Pseudomonadota bacterium]
MRSTPHAAELRKTSGMSLIELIIVVAVVAMLGTIAFPTYTNFQQKARRADAKITLEEIAAKQEGFYITNHRYTSNLAQLGLGGNLSDAGHYVINVLADDQGYTLVAAPAPGSPQANDDECQQFSINNLAVRAALPDSSGNCW